MVCGDEKEAEIVRSRIKQIVRPLYSNPPIHGARIVDTVLDDPELINLW
jgi:aspartate aminotransferase